MHHTEFDFRQKSANVDKIPITIKHTIIRGVQQVFFFFCSKICEITLSKEIFSNIF